jgi:DNA-binding Lrp family transcriptional regulator
MKELKPLDYELLFELMKNSRRSDRTLAKVLKTSQPTVTRRRARLEKDVIDGYTAIPKWDKLGYEILAITLVKSPLKLGSEKMMTDAVEKSTKWLEKQPNVIFGAECRGMGITGIMFSLHKNYAAFDEFLRSHRQQLGHVLEEVDTIIVNLTGKGVYRPLHLRYLARAIPAKL